MKTDVAYVQDKTVSRIQAKDRILEYLKHKPSITNQKAQELCGLNKNQTYAEQVLAAFAHSPFSSSAGTKV